ncbi:MAG TPA: YceI family protein [Steroidobacteraceae bacterium]|nr:YceI family protein [Steroidobacteraceae bacterium]
MKFSLKPLIVTGTSVAFAALLAGCQTVKPEPGPAVPPPAAPVEQPAPSIEGRAFQVLTAESEVRILVYRGGSLSKLGHNHVITSHDLSGTITLPEDPTQAQFEVVMPVAPLTVDEPEKRAEEGADFTAPVNDNAREGTRRNMLKPEVLDGDHFAAVTLRSASIARAGEDYDVTFGVVLRGERYELQAPVHVEVQGDRLRARGEMQVKQTELGIMPFTAAMGALAIRDEIRIKFDIHAALSGR